MSAVKKSSAKKAAPTSGPSYESMIKEAIIAHPTEARTGLGRPTIKKYINAKHPATAKLAPPQFNSLVNKAITRGADKKVFLLPKGVSGKVKLASGVKADAPAPKVVATKKAPVAKAAAAKKTTATKKAPAKKAAVTKKPAAKKTSSTASKAKKPAAKKTTVAKKAPAKKAAAKKLTSRAPLSSIQAAPKKK